MQVFGSVDMEKHGGSGYGGSVEEDSFTFSTTVTDQNEVKDLYIDMDIALPSAWEDMKKKKKKKKGLGSPASSSSSSSADFEFSKAFWAPESGYEATADELFYNGQLLPLHMPKSADPFDKTEDRFPKTAQIGQEEEKIDTFSFAGPCNVFKQENPCSPDRFPTEPYDSRSSSFRSEKNKLWDSSADSSSCRDSNGSSQDSCFGNDTESSCLHANALKGDSFPGQREKFKGSYWKRAAFGWKILAGLKRPSRKNCAHKTQSLFDASEPLIRGLLVADRPKKTLQRPYSCGARMEGFTAAEKEKDFVMNRASEVLHKYLKIFNPFSEKTEPKSCSIYEDFGIEEDRFYSGFSSPRLSTDEEKLTCSFLSGNLRVASFSRKSSTHPSRVGSTKSSPNHSGVLKGPINPTAASELHNAIQGAIAHCKQSQACNSGDLLAPKSA